MDVQVPERPTLPAGTTPLRTPLRRPRSGKSGPFLPAANAAAWLVFLGLALAVQPVRESPAPVDPVSSALSALLTIALFASAAGLLTRSRWGYAATAGGGMLLIGTAVACFAGGHSGAWLLVQGLSGAGLAATGAASWNIAR